jgi:hypothetical protein
MKCRSGVTSNLSRSHSRDLLVMVTSSVCAPTSAVMLFFGLLQRPHPDHRQSAMRSHGKAETLCEAKAQRPSSSKTHASQPGRKGQLNGSRDARQPDRRLQAGWW